MKMRTIVVTLSMALLAAPSAVAAPTRPGEAKLSEAEVLHRAGVQQMKESKFAAAAASFRASYAKDQSPRELYNAARAELAQKHFVEAAKLYRTYLSLPANEKMAATEREEAKRELAEFVGQNLSTLDVRAKTYSVDGVPGEGLVDVEPGSHSVEMHGAEGPKTKVVACAKGAVVLVEYLEPKPVIVVQPQPDKIVPPPVEPPEKGSWAVPAVLVGVGVVGLGLGIGLGAVSGSADSDVKTLSKAGACASLASVECQTAKDKESSAHGFGYGSVVGYVAGGAFLLAGVVTAVVMKPWKSRESGRELTIVPGVGGMAVVGKF